MHSMPLEPETSKETSVTTENDAITSQRKMLSEAGYALPAINYFIEKNIWVIFRTPARYLKK